MLETLVALITLASLILYAVMGGADFGGGMWDLFASEKRAEAVKSFLVANEAIASDKVEAVGYGYEQPITSNKTAAGRAQNRRIDITIITE